jgi:hypothetical protein
MNERIKLLSEQAEYYDEDEESWEFDRKKFAELIIQECIGIVKQGWISPDEDIIAEEIKEHFGVEE